MLSIRRRKVHRRSLLAIGAGFAATLSIPRRSDASEAELRATAPSSAGRDQTAEALDLKGLNPNRQVASIGYSDNTYRVTTVAGEEIAFQEFNLRFKTDATVRGPAEGRPVLLSAGMRTDRAYIIFATPHEIGVFIERSARHPARS
jgi:hypothetical protein